VVLGPELLKDMEDQMVKLKQNLKTTQDRHKVYADKNMTNREFKVREHVLLKVKPKKSSLKLGSCTKLAARFCGSFEILDKIGTVAYMLALPSFMNVHNVFHVSLLKKYVHDPNHVIDSGRDRGRLSGLANAGIGQKGQNAPESSYRAGKSSMDLLQS
jgi:hypothetical protein